MRKLREIAVEILSAGFEAIAMIVFFGALATLTACLPLTLCFCIIWNTTHPDPPVPTCPAPAHVEAAQ